jgi:hypothetical protein
VWATHLARSHTRVFARRLLLDDDDRVRANMIKPR